MPCGAVLIKCRGVMGIRVGVNPADDEGVLLHAVHAVLSIREGGPVGKGGQNSEEALAASRFLSGHAPPDPTTLMGDQRRRAQSDRSPRMTPTGSVCAQVRPRARRLSPSSLPLRGSGSARSAQRDFLTRRLIMRYAVGR